MNEILRDSAERVKRLLTKKEHELRELAKGLFYYDYLDFEEIEKIIKGKEVGKERVREWTQKEKYILDL